MSKMVNNLNQLSQSRKTQDGVVIDDTSKTENPVNRGNDSRGVYFLSFLVVILIALSAVSMSVSFKTFVQVEESWADSTAILKALSKQTKEISDIKIIISGEADKRMSFVRSINKRISGLEEKLNDNGKEVSYLKANQEDLKSSVNDTIEDLKVSDNLMLKKYILLNDKVTQLNRWDVLSTND